MKRKIGVNRDFPWNAFENQFTGWKDNRFDQLDWFSRFSLSAFAQDINDLIGHAIPRMELVVQHMSLYQPQILDDDRELTIRWKIPPENRYFLLRMEIRENEMAFDHQPGTAAPAVVSFPCSVYPHTRKVSVENDILTVRLQKQPEW